MTEGATLNGGRRPGPQDRERIAQRYPRRRHPLWIPLVALAGVLLVAWTVWSGLHRSAEPVRADLFGYRVVDDSRVDVTIDVHRSDPSVPGSCTLYALSHDNQRVGETPLRIAPANDRDVRIRAQVKTFSKAVTAQLENCRPSR